MNLVWALKKLDQERMPLIVVFADSEKSFQVIQETGYPYLLFRSNQIQQTRVKRIINFAYRQITGRNLFRLKIDSKEIPVLFGYYDQLLRFNCDRCIYWIPDLQEKYYPSLIGNSETEKRNKIQRSLSRKKVDLVFSSNAALSDFNKFFPDSRSRNTVIRFATNIETFELDHYERALDKFSITRPYFIVCNQFWPHKNHIVVIKAVEFLKNNHIEVDILFTGKEEEGSDTYTGYLKSYVKDHQLDFHIRFMGFLQREQQLMLMKGAKAVIQPSLFEGWSTVLEDAKALGKMVFASDLKVHREQMKDCCHYFEPDDHEGLALALISPDKPKVFSEDYELSISGFANNFRALLDVR